MILWKPIKRFGANFYVLPAYRRFIVKKYFLTLLAFVLFFSFASMTTSQTAQAEEVQFELLGKLGGGNSSLEKESLGDPLFDVAGGLQLSAIFRFEMGVGVGINFNWTMLDQLMANSQLTYALDTNKREITVQHPSFGLTFRYELKELIDLGLWMNYGFGSVNINYDYRDTTVANAYGLGAGTILEWDLQTFEIGIMAAFFYKITSINLDILVGLQGYFDGSRMTAANNSLLNASDIKGRRLDENAIYSGGFNIVFGARYDLIW